MVNNFGPQYRRSRQPADQANLPFRPPEFLRFYNLKTIDSKRFGRYNVIRKINIIIYDGNGDE